MEHTDLGFTADELIGAGLLSALAVMTLVATMICVAQYVLSLLL